jgi:hypothetical protein
VKNFARVSSSAQTGQSHGAGNNGDRAAAAFHRAAGSKAKPYAGRGDLARISEKTK